MRAAARSDRALRSTTGGAVPGRPLYFASAHVVDGFAQGILVETNLGRPTKIEGNPQHPDSLGATDAFGQASILTLYDPNRSQTLIRPGSDQHVERLSQRVAATVRDVADERRSGLAAAYRERDVPDLSAQIRQVLTAFPQAQWHRWQPVNRDNALAGAQLAFGRRSRRATISTPRMWCSAWMRTRLRGRQDD